jgi:DNA ligase-1
VDQALRAIARSRGPREKGRLVKALLTEITPLEAKYLVKIMTGELRVGLRESLVEEAIAKAYGASPGGVQKANMLVGDIALTLRLACDGRLAEARLRLFHPLGFMLASPAESSEEALAYFPSASVEDKYDGIRAQAHCSGAKVRIFSRTRDDITSSFPELVGALAGFSGDAVLDGEIVAWNPSEPDSNEPGRALPFGVLQRRLGRKRVSPELARQVPVAYFVFDVLYAGGELLIDRALRERTQILERLLAERLPIELEFESPQRSFSWPGQPGRLRVPVARTPSFGASSASELDRLFDQAQARGNEGLMIKDPASLYSPGRRGKAWLKLKRELAKLDVVVTAVEYGHGKRIGVLSDYTFAVRDGDELLNLGKAYSGLTDLEIARLTRWFLDHTVEAQGLRLLVEAQVVVEVAFNNITRSTRHNSGYALRFPRIVRLRPDKLPEEADTIDQVREIYRRQTTGGPGPEGKSDSV